MPDARQAVTMVLIGILGGLGQIFVTSSYREADASLIAPFDYASILLALAIGYWAVSYTHLDVYKRQPLNRAERGTKESVSRLHCCRV